MSRPLPALPPSPSGWLERFGVRSRDQVVRDLGRVARELPRGERFTFDVRSAGLLRPDLSLPAYAGKVPADGVAPIFNLFDRVGGGAGYRASVKRSRIRDFRGGRLTYEEHDGTDFVCPPGTPLVAAAPGVVVATRDEWLRGGLTACVDHGNGVVTQYTHLASLVAEVGQPVQRGETVALSGHSGFDMTQFFPWVPPHVHFMVWVHGRPVDPFLAAGEAPRAGTWAHGNEPRTSAGPLPGDASPHALPGVAVDTDAIEGALARCADPAIRDEIDAATGDMERAALLEDSLHHERFAWPADVQGLSLRPPSEPERVRLTLPLPAALYVGARPADAPWTRPGRRASA